MIKCSVKPRCYCLLKCLQRAGDFCQIIDISWRELQPPCNAADQVCPSGSEAIAFGVFRSRRKEAGMGMVLGMHQFPEKKVAWKQQKPQALVTMFQVATRKKRKGGKANRRLSQTDCSHSRSVPVALRLACCNFCTLRC